MFYGIPLIFLSPTPLGMRKVLKEGSIPWQILSAFLKNLYVRFAVCLTKVDSPQW